MTHEGHGIAGEILAFSADQVVRLTRLSFTQLRYWDETDFFSPEYAPGYRKGAFSRVYLFRDLVGLYTIALLRKQYRFSLQELRKVARYLRRFHETPWSSLGFYVSGREVFFRDPARPDSFIGARPVGQTPMSILEMEEIGNQVLGKAQRLRQRKRRQVGRIERNPYIVHNAPVLAGTRVPTRAVWNLHSAGYSSRAIIREYPRLREPDVQAAIAYEARRPQKAGQGRRPPALVVMPVLTDENVPESVANFFRTRGHDVRSVRDLFLPGTPDPVIAAAGDRLSAVVVTWNHKDFKGLASRVPRGGAAALRKLSRISFRYDESIGLRRAEQVIEIIESEYQRALKRRDKRTLIEVTTTGVRIIV